MLNRSELPANTLQRFTEIRLHYVYKTLLPLFDYKHNRVINSIMLALEPAFHERPQIEEVIEHPRFWRPHREELIDFLRFEPEFTLNRVRKVAGGSPNMIHARKHLIPNLEPISTVWTPEHDIHIKERLERHLNIYGGK